MSSDVTATEWGVRCALPTPGVDSPARDALAAEMRRALDEDMQYDDDDWTRLADAALAWFAAREIAK